MAALAGYAGTVVEGSTQVGQMDSWDLSIGRGNVDTSVFQTSPGWESNIATLGNWSGTFSGNWDTSDTGLAAVQTALLNGTTLSLKFTTDGTKNYSGTAYITGAAIKAEVAGKVTISFTFKGTGAIAYAAS